MGSNAVVAERVSRWFDLKQGRIDALREVSFEIGEGELVAVLGTNGAGKTTLTKILSTLLVPSAGQVRVFGRDVVRDAGAVRSVTASVFGGDRGLYTRLTGRDNLRFFGMLAGLGRRDLRRRLPGALEQVGLAEAADRPVETYSKGMRQRLHVAIGLIAKPRLLLLDEPTVGLDPIEAGRLRDTVAALRDEGVAILLTSHNLVDVERLAQRVLMLRRGRITHDLPLEVFARQAGHVATVTLQGSGSGLALPDPPVGMSLSDRDLRADGRWEATLHVRSWDTSTVEYLRGVLAQTSVVDCTVRESRVDEAFALLVGGADD